MMRGIDTRHEIDPSQLLRDTRTMGQRIADFLLIPVISPLCSFLWQLSAIIFPRRRVLF